MNLIIRKETPQDYRAVEELTREAFWNLYIPGCNEHYLVHTMRSHPDYLPELSFVLEKDSTIIGSIHFTHAKVVSTAGEETPVLSFGPVSILPSLHRQGYGRKLITHAIAAAAAQGYRAIIIGGFPHNYYTYGFAGSKKYHITMPDGKYYIGIMALPLYEGALDGISGTIMFSDALYPDEVGLEAYDATFPPREKQVLPCQKDFEITVAELDENEYEL